jgi:polysaccharide export outer membrane protein
MARSDMKMTIARSMIGVFLVAALAGGGCRTEGPDAGLALQPPPVMVLQPGDDVEISVFGVPELSSTQRIRPDGNISVKLFGDLMAAGKTPAELRGELTTLYESQIQVKAITVTVRSAAVVYVTGAVGRPGRIDYLRPMTVLEAIMEAGGFDQKAGARRGQVRVVRTEDGHYRNYLINLESILKKGGQVPFYLKPFDTVVVPGAW